MKIGILTQPLQYNYGGLLQNFALQTVLKEAGHNCITLDWHNIYLGPSATKFKKSNALLKHWIKILFRRYPKISDSPFDKFKESYIETTPKIMSACGFKKTILKENIDAIIVGSDQCWRPLYCFPYIDQMFLDFVKPKSKIRKLAYAASFGTDKWEYTERETKRVSKLAKDFDLITVRESSAINLCRNHLGVEAIQVLDPTLLLSQKKYTTIIENADISESPGNLYYYILDSSPEKVLMLNKIAEKLNLQPFYVERIQQRKDNYIGLTVAPSVLSWLKGFMDAKMIVVDSFHGMVFSIIFNKPFWVIANKERGLTRFESLLKLFNLEDRIITNSNDIDFNKQINWREVNELLEYRRNKSIEILLNSLINEK